MIMHFFFFLRILKFAFRYIFFYKKVTIADFYPLVSGVSVNMSLR